MDIRRLNFVNECDRVESDNGGLTQTCDACNLCHTCSICSVFIYRVQAFNQNELLICLTHINELSSWNSQTVDKYISFILFITVELVEETFCWEACLKKLFPLSHADSHLPHSFNNNCLHCKY